ncbi:hypothetical protein H311_01526 [Anncaliia algerae PRA109]|nr:hypothetical protein H311_01526 [Anncaliia algerae PRA109]
MLEKERNAFLKIENDLEHQIKVKLIELQNYTSEIKNNSKLKKEIQLIWKDIISKANEDANFMNNFFTLKAQELDMTIQNGRETINNLLSKEFLIGKPKRRNLTKMLLIHILTLKFSMGILLI